MGYPKRKEISDIHIKEDFFTAKAVFMEKLGKTFDELRLLVTFMQKTLEEKVMRDIRKFVPHTYQKSKKV